MRADRLVAALLVLQQRGRVTARELAAELEVSEKTARRDLEALAMAGIPVYSQAGKGGGWSLLGGARTDLSGLTASEARALFLLAGPSSSVSPEAKAALRKLVQALPESFRDEARKAASAVVIDPTRWGHRARATSPHLAALQQAIIDGVKVWLGYLDRQRHESERLVDPLGLVNKHETWYFVALTDRGKRTFRMDRIRSLQVTDEPARRPEGFDLEESWRSIVADVEEQRRALRAELLVEPAFVGGLRAQFGPAIVVGEAQSDGRLLVTVAGVNAHWLAEDLAGWGDRVEVVAPGDLRRQLARIGRQLLARYSDAGS